MVKGRSGLLCDYVLCDYVLCDYVLCGSVHYAIEPTGLCVLQWKRDYWRYRRLWTASFTSGTDFARGPTDSL